MNINTITNNQVGNATMHMDHNFDLGHSELIVCLN